GADPDVDGETVFEWDPDADGVSDVDNRTLYAGYHLDTETGLYHVRYRTYHPTLGRWLTRDPIDYADSMSLYQYGLSKPTRMIDPEGLRCGDCCPPTDAEDNFYKIEISKFMVLPHNTRPCDVDWDNALLALKGIELLNIVKDVGGGIAGGLAKSGEVAGAASGGLKGAVSRGFKIGKNIGMKDACLEEIEEMKKVMVTEKESWGNRGGVEMYIWLKYESCDPCTSWNPFLWFGATEYEMRTHETDEFRCTRRIIRPRTNSTPPPGPILSPYRDIEDAKAHLPDCMEEAEEALRAGRIK
ncbi:MAG TPA: RHS repeat-associated core domain-containing protein, partial [Planctomycetota bacterium]|nr:RHS repeat-associated core domain-containing protein [Planctomycetota bacterium]